MEAISGMLTTAALSDGVLVIKLCGDLDFSVTPQLIAAIEAAVDESVSACMLDCNDVTFIDSETLKAFLVLQRRLRESSQSLQLSNCSRPVARILEILGLGDVLCVTCGDEPNTSI